MKNLDFVNFEVRMSKKSIIKCKIPKFMFFMNFEVRIFENLRLGFLKV